MSLDKPTKNKMIATPPSKKGFHFASDGVYEAMYVEAASIGEAETIYQKTKKPLGVGGTENESTVAEAAQSKEPEVK